METYCFSNGAEFRIPTQDEIQELPDELRLLLEELQDLVSSNARHVLEEPKVPAPCIMYGNSGLRQTTCFPEDPLLRESDDGRPGRAFQQFLNYRAQDVLYHLLIATYGLQNPSGQDSEDSMSEGSIEAGPLDEAIEIFLWALDRTNGVHEACMQYLRDLTANLHAI